MARKLTLEMINRSMREGERLVRRIERESRGVLLEREEVARIVAALKPCIATRPIELVLTDYTREDEPCQSTPIFRR